MLYSMTGYGESSQMLGEWTMYVAIQTLNSKHLDVMINGPQALTGKLASWRKRLAETVVRGRVDITIACSVKDKPLPLGAVDKETIKRCYSYLDKLSKELQVETDVFALTLKLLMHNGQEAPIDETHRRLLDEVFERALDECMKRRQEEGKHLAKQIVDCLAHITRDLEGIIAQIPIRKKHLRKRLEDKLKMREGIVDAERWEQEVLYYVEKMAIEEECVRLRSHIAYMHGLLEKGEDVGRRLGFIVQEMLREVNTISAKAQDVTMQHLAVSIKQGIEQIREQGRNLL